MISINDVIEKIKDKNPESIIPIMKAYNLAEYAHDGVYRESGEPYIIHPLNVAMNLLNMEVYDTDAICAALLHDTVEDNEEISLEQISEITNPVVAYLVDGVTKISRMNFSTKKEQNDANTRKLVTGLNKDLRIILIKLADRLHNMNTLDFKKPQKQVDNANETMDVFVPLAGAIGAYQVKSELEDLSLMYLEPDAYKEILERREKLSHLETEMLQEIKYKIQKILNEKNIPNEILIRTKNVCNIYNKIIKGYEMENIYDLFYLKILVNEVEDCFRTLSIVHRYNPPINGRFKDYIYNPRTNYYRSLHTTVSTEDKRLRKIKIRTHDMDKVSAFGISAYWNISPNKPEIEIPVGRSQKDTQDNIRNSLQFAKKLSEIDGSNKENSDFIEELRTELLTEHVYVYKHTGEIIELPQGSTALDFACQVYPDMLDKMTGVLVNGKEVPVKTLLNNNDRVEIKTKGMINHDSWEDSVTTNIGKNKIHLLNRQNRDEGL